MEIVNAYLLAFFGANLNRTQQPLLASPSSPYPEVEIATFPTKSP
jgi:hypothetical protein